MTWIPRVRRNEAVDDGGINRCVAPVRPVGDQQVCGSLATPYLHLCVHQDAEASRYCGHIRAKAVVAFPRARKPDETRWSPKTSNGCPQRSQGVPAAAAGRRGSPRWKWVSSRKSPLSKWKPRLVFGGTLSHAPACLWPSLRSRTLSRRKTSAMRSLSLLISPIMLREELIFDNLRE